MLETKRLILKNLEISDAERIASLITYNITHPTERIPYPYDKSYAVDWIKDIQNNPGPKKDFFYKIVLKENNLLIGCCSIEVDKEYGYKLAKIGYWIGEEYWGQGFATEITNKLLEFGFKDLKLNKISATHIEDNPASGRVLEKCGFIKEGVLRGDGFNCFNFVNSVQYGITKYDYFKIDNKVFFRYAIGDDAKLDLNDQELAKFCEGIKVDCEYIIANFDGKDAGIIKLEYKNNNTVIITHDNLDKIIIDTLVGNQKEEINNIIRRC